MFYPDVEEDHLYKVIKTKDVKLPKDRVIFENGNVQHAAQGVNEKHRLRNHLYLIP